MAIDIRNVSAAETRPLRHELLRPHQPAEELVFPGDEDARARHFGAYLDGALVGIASVYQDPLPGEAGATAWRLRMMGVRPELRRSGIGRGLLDACAQHATSCGGRLLWCNARVVALDFYRAWGFEVVSDEFDVPGVGPHYRMAAGLQ